MNAVLMCSPKYFDVLVSDEKINPWMNKENRPNKIIAMAQWKELCDFLKSSGVKVNKLKPSSSFFDQTFAANFAYCFDAVAVMSNLKPSWRQKEIAYVASWLARQRISVLYLPEDFCFEGQGDIVDLGQEGILYCFGIRNDPEPYTFLQSIYDLQDSQKKIYPLQLIDKKFYHADLCIRFLPRQNTILFIPSAFGHDSLKVIESLPLRKVEAPSELYFQLTAMGRNFPLNGCSIGNVETFPWDKNWGEFPQSIRNLIEGSGGKIWLHNFDQFGLSGAGHGCCVLNLNYRF